MRPRQALSSHVLPPQQRAASKCPLAPPAQCRLRITAQHAAAQHAASHLPPTHPPTQTHAPAYARRSTRARAMGVSSAAPSTQPQGLRSTRRKGWQKVTMPSATTSSRVNRMSICKAGGRTAGGSEQEKKQRPGAEAARLKIDTTLCSQHGAARPHEAPLGVARPAPLRALPHLDMAAAVPAQVFPLKLRILEAHGQRVLPGEGKGMAE